jgi:hypothetical protein
VSSPPRAQGSPPAQASTPAQASLRLLVPPARAGYGAALLCAPGPEVIAAGAVIDLCHAASMLAFAAADQPLRRAELTDALIAAALAIAEPVTLRARRTPSL